jgi:hypothetical protein
LAIKLPTNLIIMVPMYLPTLVGGWYLGWYLSPIKLNKNYNDHSYGEPLVKMNISLTKKDQLVNLNNLKTHDFLLVLPTYY